MLPSSAVKSGKTIRRSTPQVSDRLRGGINTPKGVRLSEASALYEQHRVVSRRLTSSAAASEPAALSFAASLLVRFLCTHKNWA